MPASASSAELKKAGFRLCVALFLAHLIVTFKATTLAAVNLAHLQPSKHLHIASILVVDQIQAVERAHLGAAFDLGTHTLRQHPVER
jgi:hypothetical protein